MHLNVNPPTPYQSNLVSPHPFPPVFANWILVLAVNLSSDANLSGSSSFRTLHLFVPSNASSSSAGGSSTQISSPRISARNVEMLTFSSLKHTPPPASFFPRRQKLRLCIGHETKGWPVTGSSPIIPSDRTKARR